MAFTVTTLIDALTQFREKHGDLDVVLGTEEGYAGVATVETADLLDGPQCAIIAEGFDEH